MAESERAHKPRESSKAPKPPEKKAPEQAPPVAQRMPGWLGAHAPAGAPFPLGGVQRKVAIGASNDAYECQADQVASHVTSGQRVPPGTISPIAPVSLGGAQRQSKPEEKKKEEKPAAPMQRAVRPEDTKKDIKSAGAQLQRAAKPEEKKKDEKPASPAPVQKQAKPEEKKKDEKSEAAAPVQKQAKPEEKKKDEKPAAPPPVQKQAKPDEKKKDEKPAAAAPVQKQAKPEEKKKDEKPAAAAPVQKQDKPDEKKKDEKPAAAAPVQKQDKPEEKKKDEKPAAAPVQRSVRPEDEKKEEVPGTLPVQRAGADQAAKKEEEPVQASRGGGNAPAAPSMESAASNAIASKGPGEPLNSSTRGTLESRMGTDLSDVRVHNDTRAHEAANALNARAFTHQNDIWLGRGESQADTQLMAHEATHVVQQTGSVNRQLVQRADAPPGAGGGSAGAQDAPMSEDQAKEDLKKFPLPPVKGRHKPIYDAWASSGKLKRKAGYDRDDPDQKDSVWIPELKDKVDPQALKTHLHLEPNFTGQKTVILPNGQPFEGTYNALMREIVVPSWDRQKNPQSFEVDHIVELQVASWGESGAANTIENMELLDKRSNASSGGQTRSNVRRKVRNLLKSQGKPTDKAAVDDYLDKNDVEFASVEGGAGKMSEGASQHWTKEEIKTGTQLAGAQPVKNPGQAGSATSFALLSPGGALVLAEYHHGAQIFTIPIGNEVDQKRVAGLRITSITLNPDYTSAKEGAPIGNIQADWDLPKGVTPEGGATALPLYRSPAGQYCGYIGSLPALSAKMQGASPITFDEPSFQGGVLTANGKLAPTIPLLSKLPVNVRLRGRALELVYYYKTTDLSLPIPGLSIDGATLGIFFGTQGFGAEGSVDFSIRNLGDGSLAASVDSSRNFEASGRFNFDSKLFDQAEVNVWYRQGEFGGSGKLAINKPGKVRGIKSANITATFAKGAIDASGSVQPDIPAVEQADLSMHYDEKAGLTIGGDLQLKKDIPGLEGGSIHAEVTKKGDKYTVKASGEATPKIPGISSKLTVTYDDGAFDATVTAGFEKGMLKGTVTAGATNRPVGDDGKPAGEAPAGKAEKITLYGGGSATLKLAPWLQATADIKFKPNGEVEVTGKIGLPSAIDIFDEKKVEKNIFKIGIDIPIVPGVSLAVGGGLDLNAGIGPAQLQEVDLSVTYNPDHEDETNVHGHAALHIPAHAGLRMNVHAGLAVGIPLAKIEGGIELGGMLGIDGALHAGVDIDWTPKKGLVLDASAEVYAEPKFKFDITGYVLVEVGIGWLSKTLWEKKWQLAAVEYGSGLRLGLKLPIHYEEGKPFNISLSDIQFEVPNVDPMSVLKGLMDKIM